MTLQDSLMTFGGPRPPPPDLGLQKDPDALYHIQVPTLVKKALHDGQIERGDGGCCSFGDMLGGTIGGRKDPCRPNWLVAEVGDLAWAIDQRDLPPSPSPDQSCT